MWCPEQKRFKRMRNGEFQQAKGIALMLCASLFVCCGQLCWKLAVTRTAVFLIMGMLLYAVGALIMLYAYRFGKLSTLQPILSMNYVLSTLLGAYVLGERLTFQMGLGVLIIICGVITLGRGAK